MLLIDVQHLYFELDFSLGAFGIQPNTETAINHFDTSRLVTIACHFKLANRQYPCRSCT